jgi:hypothetical protein
VLASSNAARSHPSSSISLITKSNLMKKRSLEIEGLAIRELMEVMDHVLKIQLGKDN